MTYLPFLSKRQDRFQIGIQDPIKTLEGQSILLGREIGSVVHQFGLLDPQMLPLKGIERQAPNAVVFHSPEEGRGVSDWAAGGIDQDRARLKQGNIVPVCMGVGPR
jgi:hypothetical protein